MDYWTAFDSAPDQEDAVRGFEKCAECVPDLEAPNRELAAIGHLGAAGVGSTPHAWGVFSGVPQYHLELTLQKLYEDKRTTSRAAREEALQLLQQLPCRRLDAYKIGAPTELDVQEEVLALAANLAPSRRKALIEHLPGDVRPLTTSLEELRRPQPPIMLYLSRYGSSSDDLRNPPKQDIEIRLSDIVVSRPVAGLGLGSAALSHLCRCADDIGATITGELYPGSAYDNEQQTRIPRLARWYARHGFTVGDLPAAHGGSTHR